MVRRRDRIMGMGMGIDHRRDHLLRMDRTTAGDHLLRIDQITTVDRLLVLLLHQVDRVTVVRMEMGIDLRLGLLPRMDQIMVGDLLLDLPLRQMGRVIMDLARGAPVGDRTDLRTEDRVEDQTGIVIKGLI